MEYHVVARINRQEYIFESDLIKNLFLKTVKQAKKHFSFRIRNFCIMSNHIHLLIRPGKGESLSKIMQWILGVFAIRYNRICGIHGHVWYDRFHSTIINTIQQLIHAFRYISDNPVKAGIVDNCLDYAFSGIRFLSQCVYDILEPPDMLTAVLLSFIYIKDK